MSPNCASPKEGVLLANDPASREAIMKKEIFQENKARWELFEQVSSLNSKIVWSIVAVVVALGALYLLT
jgi:hypothetical protein